MPGHYWYSALWQTVGRPSHAQPYRTQRTRQRSMTRLCHFERVGLAMALKSNLAHQKPAQ